MKKSEITKEYGAVTIVEATFVFPIMFFVLFILLFYGNACYIQSNIDSSVSICATEAAAEIADPLLKGLKDTGAVETSINSITNYPYRYLSSGYGNGVAQKAKNNLINQIEDFSGFLGGMSPQIAKCSVEYKNYVLYQTVKVSVDYNIVIPIRMIFVNEPIVIKYSSVDEAPVSDTAEFVLNTNMVVDYVERTGIAEKIAEMVDKVKNFL